MHTRLNVEKYLLDVAEVMGIVKNNCDKLCTFSKFFNVCFTLAKTFMTMRKIWLNMFHECYHVLSNHLVGEKFMRPLGI